jgi:excisionase family DNA binding protein
VKTIFTTGEAANVAYCSQQTIIRLFDTGQLKGFRVPGSRFRRILRESLLGFMTENGIPTDRIGLFDARPPAALAVSDSDEAA